jgi:molecular chaperone HtpG
LDYRFQVNLRGIIELLANNLYSGPQVFLRELLQNGVDAVRARRQADPAFTGGRILIEVSSSPADAAPPTITCEDDGIGLTEEQVHRFLATIGESSKRDDLGAARADFIGQFGIGLLSCFMVADEIVMITRAAGGGRATEWRGRPDGTYSVRTLDADFAAGTRVYLRCKPGREEFFEPARVRDLARHYGGLLPFEVRVTAGRGTWVVNGPAPWELTYASADEQREALLAYGREAFGGESSDGGGSGGGDFFDCIPLRSEAGDVGGVAFVLPYSPSPSAKARHRVYLKRMLLSEAGEGVLPEWAFFVRCVVNANALRPTASREAFYEDDTLAAARDALGGALRDYLFRLARVDPDRLARLVAIHALAVKALAVHDEEFYRIFIDWVPFETSLGVMSMRELRREHPALKYVPTVDEFRQLARVAASQGLCIVNGGYTYAEELLLRLPDVFDGVSVERTGAAELSQAFEELSLDERDGCLDLLRAADVALRPFRCAPDVRRFKPAELAALYSTDPDGALFRAAEQGRDLGASPLTAALDDVLGLNRDRAYAQLLLNYDNPLVRRLAGVKERGLLVRCVQMLYVQALLLGHRPLTAKELSLMNDGLSGLIDAALPRSAGDRGGGSGGNRSGGGRKDVS